MHYLEMLVTDNKHALFWPKPVVALLHSVLKAVADQTWSRMVLPRPSCTLSL